jgi:hypothetical protein
LHPRRSFLISTPLLLDKVFDQIVSERAVSRAVAEELEEVEGIEEPEFEEEDPPRESEDASPTSLEDLMGIFALDDLDDASLLACYEIYRPAFFGFSCPDATALDPGPLLRR